VIDFKAVGGLWRFFDYVSSANDSVIEEWLNQQSFETAEMFQAVLKNIHKIDSHLNWGIKRYLKGKKKGRPGIWELPFSTSEKREYRILGCFGTGAKEATLLLVCYHKQNVYTPRDAIKTGFDRAADLIDRRAQHRVRQIRTDS